jgi:hypothetical protein
MAPFADPVVGDGDVALNCDAVDGDETDGNKVVVSPETPDPTALSLLFALPLVWPVGCDTVGPSTVWPWAAVMPISIAAMMKMGFIALSCTQLHRTTPKPQKWKMKFRKGPGKEPHGQRRYVVQRQRADRLHAIDAIVTFRKSGTAITPI